MIFALPQTRFRRGLTRAIALPIVLLLLLSGVSIWQITRLLSALRWVDHTNQVISQANSTQKLLLDMETGLRGYLLTGQQNFLAPYEQANAAIDPSMGELKRLVADNPGQAQRVTDLIAQSNQWEQKVSPAITRRQRGESTPLSELERWKQDMDRMRQQIASFIATEEKLRDQRSQAAQGMTQSVILTSLLLALGVGIVLAYLIRRQILQVSQTYENALHTAEVRTEEVEQSAIALQRSAQRLAALHSIDRAILAAETDETLINNALVQLRQIVLHQQAIVAVFNLEAGTAQILAGTSLTGELSPPVGAPLTVADFAPEQRLLHGIRYIENLAAAETYPPVLMQLRSHDFCSCLCVPLLVENTLVGELNLASTEPAAFDKEAQEIAHEVAAQLAIALQQSRLQQQLRASNQQLQRELAERQHAENELREQEQLFRSTFNQAAVGIGHVSPNGRWLRVNQRLCEIVGYTHEELLQRTFQDITYPEDLDIDLTYVHQILANEISTYSMEKRYICKDNSLVWINLTVSLVREASERPKYFISVIEDISDRKRAEAALQQSLKELADFKFALDQSSIVAVTDVQGTITYVNDKFCEISQYSRDELIGQNHRIVNSGYHPQAFFQQMWATIASGRVWQGEIRNCAKDSTFYWVATTIVPFLDVTGKPYQYMAIRSDITARKVAEAQLQQLNITLEQRVSDRTAQLEETNQELEAFTYSVSHDLRAPLRTIQGFAKAMLEDCGEQLEDLCRIYIDSIMDDTVQMNGLISDLLDYSRLTRAQISLQTTALNDIVEEALKQLTAQIQERQAQIRVASSLPQVIAHRSTLIQVVANLISNGIKFTEPDTQPQIDIFATTESQDHQDWVRLWVVDKGIGIAPEHQERVFRVFERLHGAERYPGTGIGLAIVRKGLDRMGGRVGVESQLGQGSRFWIALPNAVS